MFTPGYFFKNKGMSAEKTRIQWQEKCSDCEGITGRKGLCSVSGDKKGSLSCIIQGVKKYTSGVLEGKTIMNTYNGDKSWVVLQ